MMLFLLLFTFPQRCRILVAASFYTAISVVKSVSSARWRTSAALTASGGKYNRQLCDFKSIRLDSLVSSTTFSLVFTPTPTENEARVFHTCFAPLNVHACTRKFNNS